MARVYSVLRGKLPPKEAITVRKWSYILLYLLRSGGYRASWHCGCFYTPDITHSAHLLESSMMPTESPSSMGEWSVYRYSRNSRKASNGMSGISI